MGPARAYVLFFLFFLFFNPKAREGTENGVERKEVVTRDGVDKSKKM